MPPALSDDENAASSGEEEIPYRGKSKDKVPQPEAEAEAEAEAEQDDEGDEDGDPEEYAVEKIMSHKFDKDGTVQYEVKWVGWDDPKDRTWEPEDNLEGAREVLEEYWEEIGGRPEQQKGKKRKGRKSAAATESEAGTPASSKRVKKEREWSPPAGSWETDVDYVDTVEEKTDPKTGDKKRFAYLVWTNRKKSQHPLHHVYAKCPQKMLQYYESHLVFTKEPEEVNGGDEDMAS